MTFFVGLLALIGCFLQLAMLDDMTLGMCCQVLTYDIKEGDIVPTGLNVSAEDLMNNNADVSISMVSYKSTSSDAEKHLDMCGFKEDGSDFTYSGKGDIVFGTE